MDPIDQYLSVKEAGVGGFARDFASGAAESAFNPKTLGGAAGVAMIGAAGTALGAAATHAYRAITKQRDFKAMLSHNADLVDEHANNPQQFNQMYSSFRAMNPQFAADPIVAGTYMRQMAMSPSTAGHAIVSSLKDAPRAQTPAWVDAVYSQIGKQPQNSRAQDPLSSMKLQQLKSQMSRENDPRRQEIEDARTAIELDRARREIGQRGITEY